MSSKIQRKSQNIQECLSIHLIYISIFCSGLTLISLFITHGEMFSKIFFHDSLDTGMDFFHSIEYTRGRAPYELFETLYPPLANLFFYILYKMIPYWQSTQWANTFMGGISARGSFSDLRVWQPTMVLFILFIIIVTIVFVILLQKILSNVPYSNILAVCLFFNYGIIYAFERGNIAIIAVLLSLFFVVYRNDKNKYISELALLALAIAAGLKIYPAILGFLLLYDKQYRKAIRAIFYGLAMFILPTFVFKEGISSIGKFINILTNFIVPDKFSTEGFSFDKIVNAIVLFVEYFTGNVFDKSVLLEKIPSFNFIFVLVAVICGFFLRKNWQRVLACNLALVLCQGQGIYNLSFMIIPLVILLREERKFTSSTILPFCALLNFHMILPNFKIVSDLLSFTYVRIQLGIIITFVYILTLAIKNITDTRKTNILKRRSSDLSL